MNTFRSLVVIGVLALTAAQSSTGFAGDGCSMATHGTYLYRVTGAVSNAGVGKSISTQASMKPFAAVGLLKLESGSGTGSEASSEAGVLGERSFSVTYSVGSDCSATLSLADCTGDCPGAILAPYLAVTGDGSHAWLINAVSQTQLSGELHRVPDGGCANTAITGAYRYMTGGAGMNAHSEVLGSSLAFASAGFEVFGDGGSGQDVIALGGVIIPRLYESSVPSLNSNCSGELGAGSLHTSKIYAASDGSEFVLLDWFPGTVVSGWYQKQ